MKNPPPNTDETGPVEISFKKSLRDDSLVTQPIFASNSSSRFSANASTSLNRASFE